MSNDFSNNLQLVSSAGLEAEHQSAYILFDVWFVVYSPLKLKSKGCQFHFIVALINIGQMGF